MIKCIFKKKIIIILLFIILFKFFKIKCINIASNKYFNISFCSLKKKRNVINVNRIYEKKKKINLFMHDKYSSFYENNKISFIKSVIYIKKFEGFKYGKEPKYIILFDLYRNLKKKKLYYKYNHNIYSKIFNNNKNHEFLNNNDYIDNNNKEINKIEKKKENNERIKNKNEKIRNVLTDTKYYKRSKYSKAGLINKNKKLNENEYNIEDNFLNNYTESIEDLEKIKKEENKYNNMNMADILITNYFLDKNKQNNLDIIDNLNINKISLNNNLNDYMNIKYNEIKKDNLEKKSKINEKKIEFMNEFTIIGEIIGIHGLNGYVKVNSFTTFNDMRFQKNSYRYIFMNNYSYPLPIKIMEIKNSLKINFFYIKFYGINTRSDAMKIQNALICVSKKDFPSLEENKYLSTDLLNFNIYIFNDFSNTCIGSVINFVSKHDYINSSIIQEIAENLIKIKINNMISFKNIFNIIKLAKSNENNETSFKYSKDIEILMDNISNVSSNIEYKEDDILNNVDGHSYKKIFKCDYCDYVFNTIKEAREHENSHLETNEYMNTNIINNNVQYNEYIKKQKFLEINEKNIDKTKNIDSFFIPIIKEKTIRSVNYEMKKIYLDISTIFIIDNQKSKKENVHI